jgi:hypothetical protein
MPASIAARIESGRRFGYREGYEKGYDAGDLRRRRRETTDFTDECDYHASSETYVASFGPQEAYEEGYRAGFEQGFLAGLADKEYENITVPGHVPAGNADRPAEVPAVGEKLHGWRPVARLNGYEAGLQRGRTDRVFRRLSTDLKRAPEYANALDGWSEGACDQASFQALYRQYYILGYNEGRSPEENKADATQSPTAPSKRASKPSGKRVAKPARTRKGSGRG